MNLLKQIATALVAVVLIWFCFRGANLAQIWRLTQQASKFWLVMICLSSLSSHLCRALRWLILLRPLRHSPSQKQLSLWNSFVAIIYGYAVNIAVPRGGEIVRLVTFSRLENLSWASVLPTLFIDRLLDVAMLALILGATILILPISITQSMPWIVPSGVSLALTSVLFLVSLPQMGRFGKWILAAPIVGPRLPLPIKSKASELLSQFDEGTRALTNPLAYPALAALSLAMWGFYWLNSYLLLLAMHLVDKVTIANITIVFALSSASVLVPTPGSIGSYHLVVKQALMLTSGLDENTALAYATIGHALVFMFVNVGAALACLAINTNKKGFK